MVTHAQAWGHRSRRAVADPGTDDGARGATDAGAGAGAGTAGPWPGLPTGDSGLAPRRQVIATALTVALIPALTVLLSTIRGTFNLATEMLAYLLVTVTVAVVGGFGPALLCAVAGSLLLNYYFTPPLHHWSVADGDNALAIVGFVLVAGLVSRVVSVSARRYSQAVRASAEAATLSVLAGSVLRGEDALPALLARVRETFGMTSATLLERVTTEWRPVLSVGIDPCSRPEDGAVDVPAGENLHLVLTGRALPAADRGILAAFAAQAAVALEQRRLAEAAARAEPIAEANKLRTALLAAVSHDLRTPLAAAKAAISALRGRDIPLTGDEQAELLATADESLDRLTRLVENLLDMSRLQAGALSVFLRPIGLDDVVPYALDEIGPPARKVDIQLADDLPAVHADPALLERIIVNLVANALRHAPSEVPPVITGSTHGDRVELRVIDRGPGIPEAHRDDVFQPFQRLGDRDNTTGVGLGLALSRGLTEAMHGTLTPDDTPGGGLTMVLSLPAATVAATAAPTRAAPGRALA
jgi:two-component system sensor histidine kinase KdpD